MFQEPRRSLLAWAVALALVASASAAPAFEARETIDLPAGVRVEVDGRGGIRALLDDEILLQAEQVLVYGEGDLARSAHLASEAPARQAGPTAVVDQAEVGLAGTRLVSRVHSWRYFHVDDIAFVDSFLEFTDQNLVLPARAGLDVILPENVRWLRREERPHRTDGRARNQEFLIARVARDLEDGTRLHIGLVRLDAADARLSARDQSVVWTTNSAASWPLAVIVARSERSLLHLAGQARLTFDQAGEATWSGERWRVPTLCGRCQDEHLDRLAVEFSEINGDLEIEARVREGNDHGQIDLEGLVLNGIPLGAHYIGEGRGGRALFRTPLDGEVAESLLIAARLGDLRGQAWSTSNEPVEAREVEFRLAPSLADGLDLAAAGYESEELPTHLSPRLVRSWPNPFEQSTNIEITIPSDIGEAFDLEGSLAQRVNPSDPPPFGDHPTVSVKVFNVSGKLVKVLEQGDFGPGAISVTWDGHDVRGQSVASGAYYVHVRMGEWSVTQRVLRLGS